MGLVNIMNKDVKLVMVGGKGGVGKTTCASAIALKLAMDGKRVLVISSDPTPSLSDIFEVPIGSEEVKITEKYALYGLEIASDVVLAKWKERFGDEIYEVISTFANVDYDFVDYVGTAPGIEEEYMLSFIIELVESDKYDIVVWDPCRPYLEAFTSAPSFSQAYGGCNKVLYEHVWLSGETEGRSKVESVQTIPFGNHRELGIPFRKNCRFYKE